MEPHSRPFRRTGKLFPLGEASRRLNSKVSTVRSTRAKEAEVTDARISRIARGHFHQSRQPSPAIYFPALRAVEFSVFSSTSRIVILLHYNRVIIVAPKNVADLRSARENLAALKSEIVYVETVSLIRETVN